MQDPQGNCDIAHITDADGRVWVCRRPRDTHAGMALESEAVLLNLLTRAGLPFEVPRPTGFATLPAGGRAMVYPLIEGDKPYFFDAEPGSVLLDHIARAIAALHEMPLDFAENSSVTHYSASEYRERRITTLNLAEQTGKVPDTLITRWRRLFHDVDFWTFRPVLTHAGLSMETLLVTDDEVRGVTQWGSAQIADPCDDLAWLVGQLNYTAAEYFFERYLARRNPLGVDPNMWERANLISEMEPMDRMLSAHRAGDAEAENYARVMLIDLEDSLAESVRRQAEFDLETTLQQGVAMKQGLPFTLGDEEPGGFVTGGIRVLHPHSAVPGGAGGGSVGEADGSPSSKPDARGAESAAPAPLAAPAPYAETQHDAQHETTHNDADSTYGESEHADAEHADEEYADEDQQDWEYEEYSGQFEALDPALVDPHGISANLYAATRRQGRAPYDPDAPLNYDELTDTEQLIVADLAHDPAPAPGPGGRSDGQADDAGVERVVGANSAPRYNVSYSVSTAIEVQPRVEGETPEDSKSPEKH